MTVYRVTIAIAHIDVMRHDFSEEMTARRCLIRMLADDPTRQTRLWIADSVRAGKLVNARLLMSHN